MMTAGTSFNPALSGQEAWSQARAERGADLLARQARQAQGSTAQGSTQTLSPKDLDRMRQTAEEFEATFLSQMFNHLFSGVKTDAMFGGGPGEDKWKSLMVDEYAKATAKRGGIGLADHVMASLIQAQEASR